MKRSRTLFAPIVLLAAFAAVVDACSSGDDGAADPSTTTDASIGGDAAATGDATIGPNDAAPLVDSGTACPPGLPAAVVAAGYCTSTLETPSFTKTNLDLAGTYASGFQWYVWNLFSKADASAIVPSTDGGPLLLAGDVVGPNAEVSSGARVGSKDFVGTAFGGGGYFEAVFAFNRADVVATDFKGWPSWWSLPIDRIMGTPPTWWNGDAADGYDHHIEVDFFEYDTKGRAPNVWGGTFHDWYGVPNVTCGSGECDWHTPTSQNLREAPDATDWAELHSVGFLWIPATATTKGSGSFYFDRVPSGETVTWNKWTDVPEPTNPPVAQTPTPPWALSWLDEAHILLVLGTGVNQPMKVQRVGVWQASAAGNLRK